MNEKIIKLNEQIENIYSTRGIEGLNDKSLKNTIKQYRYKGIIPKIPKIPKNKKIYKSNSHHPLPDGYCIEYLNIWDEYDLFAKKINFNLCNKDELFEHHVIPQYEDFLKNTNDKLESTTFTRGIQLKLLDLNISFQEVKKKLDYVDDTRLNNLHIHIEKLYREKGIEGLNDKNLKEEIYRMRLHKKLENIKPKYKSHSKTPLPDEYCIEYLNIFSEYELYVKKTFAYFCEKYELFEYHIKPEYKDLKNNNKLLEKTDFSNAVRVRSDTLKISIEEIRIELNIHVKFVTFDGIAVKSNAEMIFYNIIKLNIDKIVYEIPYNNISKGNLSGKYTCDFKITIGNLEIFCEIWMFNKENIRENNSRYNKYIKNREKKEDFWRKNTNSNVKFIGIEWNDINRNDNNIIEFLYNKFKEYFKINKNLDYNLKTTSEEIVEESTETIDYLLSNYKDAKITISNLCRLSTIEYSKGNITKKITEVIINKIGLRNFKEKYKSSIRNKNYIDDNDMFRLVKVKEYEKNGKLPTLKTLPMNIQKIIERYFGGMIKTRELLKKQLK